MKFLNDLNVEDGHIQLDDTYKIQWGGSNARIDGSNASDYIRLWTSDTERMRIDSSGNVGIGTASPESNLHVYTPSGQANIKIQSGSNDAVFFANAAVNFGIWGFDNTRLSLGTNSTERVSITGDGNVGIGTTSPSGALHVQKSISGGFGGIIYNTQSTGGFGLSVRGGNSSSEDALRIQNVGGTYLLNVKGDGNVGIGTTSPSQKLHVAGNLRVTGAYYDSNNAPGTLDQVLTSTATGVAWVDPSTITAEAATLVVIECKNTSGATITKGTPVYQTGIVGATDVIEIAPADALISAGKQPAIGLLQTTLNNNGFGKVVITGEFLNFTTDPIDGVTPTTGDKVFLKSGGGLTLTKPTGEGNGIQNLGLIGKVSSGNAGSITVSSIMRTNDVPNLPTGKIWVGDGNTIVSDTVFLDEPNGRMGIGTTSPDVKLEVVAASPTDGIVADFVNSTNAGGTVAAIKLSNADSEACDVVLGANRVGANFGSDFFISLSDGVDGTNQERLRITESGNVGIGTTSPSTKLQISTATNVITPLITLHNSTSTNGSTAGASIDFVASSNVAATGARIISTRVADGAHMDLRFHTQRDQFAMIIDTSGNVGIGTTSPLYKLDVNGETNADAYRINLSATTQRALSSTGTDSLQIGDAGVNDIKFKNAAGSSFIINSSGNVGIGTTSPSQKLEVNGNIKIGDAQKSLYGTGDDLQIYHDGSNSYINDSGTGELKIASDTLRITNAAGTETSAKFVQDSFVELFHNNSSKFKTTASGADVTGALSTTSGGAFGTDSQTASIYMSVQNQGLYGNFGGYARNLIKSNNSNVVEIGHSSSLVSGISLIAGSSAVNGTITFSTKQSERMRVHHNGNVGIGTTSPGQKLHVSGGHILLDNNTEIRQKDSGGSERTIIELDSSNDLNIGGSYAGALKFIGGGSYAEVMRIHDDGNVGIGTTSPAAVFEVKTVDANRYIRFKAPNGEERFEFYTGGTGNPAGLFMYNSDGTTRNVQISAGGNSFLNGGNVGIGTTSPSAKLHVIGSVIISDDNPILTIGDNDSTIRYSAVKISTNGGNWYLSSGDSNTGSGVNASDLWITRNETGSDNRFRFHRDHSRFSIYSSGTQGIQLDGGSGGTSYFNAGNVGIGTTSPAEKLHVLSSGNTVARFETSLTSDMAIELKNSQGSMFFGLGGGEEFAVGTDADLNGTNSKFVVKSSGNVGIGTTSPSYPLEVKSASPFVTTNSTGTGNSGFAMLVNAGSNGVGVIATDNGGSLTFDNGATGAAQSEKMRITSAGNVGIGITNPAYKLDVAGETRIALTADDRLIINQATENINFGLQFAYNGTRNWDIYNQGIATSPLYFYSQQLAGPALTLKTDGVIRFNQYGAGYLKSDASGNITVDASTIEDTLDSVTDRGATTTNDIEVGNITTKNDSGIYSFNDTVDASASEDIFSISNNHGAQAFRVIFVCNTSAYSVAKTFEVVHSYGNAPVFFKVVDTGAYGTHDFDVSFTNDATDDSKVVCSITNNSTTINANIVTTVFLGGSPTAITVTAL